MTISKQHSVRLKGVGVSSGIVLGKAFSVDRGKVEIATYYSLKNKKTYKGWLFERIEESYYENKINKKDI